ncbi:hypothetical protein AWJ20_4407 [Sugiyamaella lignohabitans]|uniref:Rab-GAP TBC domain-containing protein n=1 Tax=Sugiyamaella lignohabitans TaxID=796027 RepID=A0A161HHG5_9ASCO|nr:uncharacterized protein AWJ20_4407 [Sugiyamaella lignohabitans]ANB11587.1 hypothetical protein AWJ20_4407 [Sugiyamaella lignohabitans]
MSLVAQWDRAVSERYPDLTMLRKSIWRGTLREESSNSSSGGGDGNNGFPPRSILWKVLLLYGTFDSKSWNASQERDLRRYNSLIDRYGDDIDPDGLGSGSNSSDGAQHEHQQHANDDNAGSGSGNDSSNDSNFKISENASHFGRYDEVSGSTGVAGAGAGASGADKTNTTIYSPSPSKSAIPTVTTRVVDDPLSQGLSSVKGKKSSLLGQLKETTGSDEFEDVDLTMDSFYEDDEDLSDIIMRDVERAFPEVDFFRDNDVQYRLHRILYIYARQNRDIGYRQGMHELAGPMLWVMANDSDQGIVDTYVESDAYTVFQAVMKNAKAWYLPPKPADDRGSTTTANSLDSTGTGSENGSTGSNSKSGSLSGSPRMTKSSTTGSGENILTRRNDPVPEIVVKSQKIQESILKIVDPELYNVLVSNEIEPQIWGIRWIRLIFGREFGFNQMLRLWDALFAADGSTLELIDHICVIMLIRIRKILLEEPHYAEILTTLLNYPTDQAQPPYLYIINALYLKSHLNPESGKYVFDQFEKYNRVEAGTSSVPEKEDSQNYASTTSPGLSPFVLPSLTSTAFNLESIRDAAITVSKRFDIDRRVRDAFEKQRPRALAAAGQLVRNEALAELLDSSLTILEKVARGTEAAPALDAINHVRECLLDEKYPLDKIESRYGAHLNSELETSNTKNEHHKHNSLDDEDMKALVENESSEAVEPDGESILLVDGPVASAHRKGTFKSPSRILKTPTTTKKTPNPFTEPGTLSPSPARREKNTPIRTSILANSDFSWMLDSPGPSPPDIRSSFKSSSSVFPKTEGPTRAKAADIFELS